MTPLPNHWPALVAGVRLARVPFDQRAYRNSDAVRFFPSELMVWNDGGWQETIYDEDLIIGCGHTRLPDHEAARLWATRPQKENGG